MRPIGITIPCLLKRILGSTAINDRFRLGLPQVPLRLDSSIRRNCAGYFRPGHNEFGLAYEIAIAVPMPEQLATLDHGEVLGTLLHEALHLLQELTGMPGRNNYHNSQFRDTAERFGLLVDYRGHQKYSIDSPFLDLLAEYGVEPPLAVRVERACSKRSYSSSPIAAWQVCRQVETAKVVVRLYERPRRRGQVLRPVYAPGMRQRVSPLRLTESRFNPEGSPAAKPCD